MNKFEPLVQAAIDARDKAYAPYSNYFVGAAVLTKSGNIYSAGNIENSSYGVTICAERVAVFKVISAQEQIIAIAVATKNQAVPCGACLQVMQEFCSDKTPVYVVDASSKSHQEFSFRQLLPYDFQNKA